jgi:hypothetical protein
MTQQQQSLTLSCCSFFLIFVFQKVVSGFAAGDWSDHRMVRAVAWLLGAMVSQADLHFVIVAATKPSS